MRPFTDGNTEAQRESKVLSDTQLHQGSAEVHTDAGRLQSPPLSLPELGAFRRTPLPAPPAWQLLLRAPEQGSSSHQGLGEHSAPGHRLVTTQRRLLTTVSPVGLSSVELGQTGPQVWCLLSVPGPLGQRDRPGHGKGPVALGTPRAGRDASRFGSESAGGRADG